MVYFTPVPVLVLVVTELTIGSFEVQAVWGEAVAAIALSERLDYDNTQTVKATHQLRPLPPFQHMALSSIDFKKIKHTLSSKGRTNGGTASVRSFFALRCSSVTHRLTLVCLKEIIIYYGKGESINIES